MEMKFWKTRAGAMTKAFLVIMAAFVIILIGLKEQNTMLCSVGFVMIAGAMLYAPYDTFKRKSAQNNGKER